MASAEALPLVAQRFPAAGLSAPTLTDLTNHPRTRLRGRRRAPLPEAKELIMTTSIEIQNPNRDWLKTYYYLRFAVSAAWVILAFAVGRSVPTLAAIMLVAYPAWDAIANYLDASRSGGMARNKSQMLNFVVSMLTAVAVAAMLGHGMHEVLKVFGVWASLSGLLQLATGVRRWKSYGAQWVMILSGAQSALAGVFMLKQAAGAQAVSIASIAPYAAFGALYFLISAISLTVSDARRRSKIAAA
jgi:uncharacterized membrane protein HdeD (DUF308 family)